MTCGMGHSRSRQGGKAVPRFARAVWGGIGALAALLASPAPAVGFSLDWDRDARDGGALAWIVAVVERELPPLETGAPVSPAGKPELVRLAATTVPDPELAELRGGFVTIGGVDLDIGFDFRTFINGALVVHNVLTPTGGGAEGGSLPSISSSATVVTLVSNGNGSVTQVINGILPGGGGGGSDDGGLPDVISNIVTSDGGGPLNVLTEITMNDGGVTQVLNRVGGGGVSTTIINTAGGLHINQTNTTTISLLNHNLPSINHIRSGGPLGGSPHMPLGLMGALIGVIAR